MPLRLDKLNKRLKSHGIAVEHGAKHFKLRRGDGSVFPLPAHNGLKSEIPDMYLKHLCKHFDLELDELKK